MNLKVRLRNPVFWLTLIPACLTVAYTLCSLLGVVPKISESDAINVVTVIISALTTLGVLVDPTTKGVGDSDRAMTYEEPAE